MDDDRLPERFWDKVQKSDSGCWKWTAAKTASGYGNFKVSGKALLAHRVAYVELVGEIPEGLVIDHLCRNRACVNPSHLEPVTIRTNVLRGFGWTAIQARKTQCNNGHEFTETNTYRFRGKRLCRRCNAEIKRRARRGGEL